MDLSQKAIVSSAQEFDSNSNPLALRTLQMALTGKEKESLLLLARRSIEESLKTESINGSSAQEFEKTDGVLERRGAFVTLKSGESLRGCIGTFSETLQCSCTSSRW